MLVPRRRHPRPPLLTPRGSWPFVQGYALLRGLSSRRRQGAVSYAFAMTHDASGDEPAPTPEEIQEINRAWLHERRHGDRRSGVRILWDLFLGLPFVNRERTRIHDDRYAPGTDPRDDRMRHDTPRGWRCR